MPAPCPRCGTAFDPLSGRYAPDATIVCVPCGEQLAAAQQTEQKRVAGSPFAGAIASVLIALGSFLLEHKIVFFLFPIVAIVIGVMTAHSALRNPDSARALGSKRVPTVLLGAFGSSIGLLSLVLSFAVR